MRARHVLCLLTALAGAAGWTAVPSIAATAKPGVVVRATINGIAAGAATAGHPVNLHPSTPASVRLVVSNQGTSAVTVRRVDISARVLGLSFYGFDTSVGLTVEPHSTATLSYRLDLSGLGGQATGEMNATVALFDGRGHEIAQQSVITDVRGSLYSVYGMFGLALVLLTLLAFADVALAIARHRLPRNRWRRALRTMTPGIGIGMVLVFSLSAASVWAPTPNRWLLVAVGAAVVFFVLGYLTPTPTSDSDSDSDDDDEEFEGEPADDAQAGDDRLEIFPPTHIAPLHQTPS